MPIIKFRMPRKVDNPIDNAAITVRDRLKVGYPTFKLWESCGAGRQYFAAARGFLKDFV